MTLIIANAEGLYADRRVIIKHSGQAVEGGKTRRGRLNNCAFGVSGLLQAPSFMFDHMGSQLAALSFFAHLVPRFRDSGPKLNVLLDILPHVATSVLYHNRTCLSNVHHPLLVAITPYHTFVYADRDWSEYIKGGEDNLLTPDTFACVGSAAKAAYIFDNLGLGVQEIYQRASKIDDMVSAKFDHVKRSSLHTSLRGGSLIVTLPNIAKALKTVSEIDDEYVRGKNFHDSCRGYLALSMFALQIEAVERTHKVTQEPLPYKDKDLFSALATVVGVWRETRDLTNEQLADKMSEFFAFYKDLTK